MNEPERRGSKSLCRLLAVFLILLALGSPVHAETVWRDLNARYARVPQLEYEGVRYRLKPRLTTILLAGVDNRGDAGDVLPSMEYRSGGQADFLMLLAIDDAAKTVTPLQIDRDTMTEITVLNVLGQVSGTRTAQICLSHSFGDGKEYSCELMSDAVSKLLLGTPINHYYVMNMDGIAAFNDALGGVEVTLEDDFSAYDPEMTAGKTLVLHGKQAEIYVRQRYHVGNQSNIARLRRQEVYIQRVTEVLSREIKKRASFVDALLDVMDVYTTTDMSRGRLINMADKIKQYTVHPPVKIPGESLLGENGRMEFYADENMLGMITLDVFYESIV
ncbi:MAG: LytR family transcriptional regulator [Clostridiales bacterium]|nr:LytR family transcriptional regulator [Clostridiales bacterium]